MENKYLEIIEQTEEAIPKIVKVEVKSKAEAESKIASVEKEFIGKKYIACYHICRHENGNNQPCEIEILKEAEEKINFN